MKYAMVLCEKQSEDGLTKKEAISMIHKLSQEEFYLIEIEAKHHECSAMGFITAEFANNFEYDYETSGLSDFISEILDDMDKESTSGIYMFKGQPVLLARH